MWSVSLWEQFVYGMMGATVAFILLCLYDCARYYATTEYNNQVRVVVAKCNCASVHEVCRTLSQSD